VPVFATSIEAIPLTGRTFFTAPGRSPALLRAPRLLPVGSTLDTLGGRVRLIAVDPTGATHAGEFYAGVFRIRQPAAEQGVVELMLAGPVPACGAASAMTAARTRSGRHVWSKADPYYSPNGYSARTTPKRARGFALSAAVSATTWATADGCASGQPTTAVMVTQGAVLVTNPLSHKPAAGSPVVTPADHTGCYSGRFRTRGRFSAATVRGSADAHAARASRRVLRALVSLCG
jgi:hypothetical protein